MDCSSLFGAILFAIAIGDLAWAAGDAACALGAEWLGNKRLEKRSQQKRFIASPNCRCPSGGPCVCDVPVLIWGKLANEHSRSAHGAIAVNNHPSA